MAVITGSRIDVISFVATLGALKLEMKGIRVTRGYSAYATVKRRFGLKGNRQRVYDQFQVIVENAKRGIWPEGYTPRQD